MNFVRYLLVFVLGAWIYYELFASPKAQIKRLWKKIFKLSFDLAKMRKESSETAAMFERPYKEAKDRLGKMINALLDYYFSSEDNTAYYKENRYDSK